MAVFTIHLAPRDSSFVPSDEQLQQVQSLLSSYCSWNEDKVKIKRFAQLTLVDSGVAFDSLVCPLCGGTINRFGNDDYDKWWIQMEDQIQTEDPLSVNLVMPCCGERALAQELSFGMDACFTRWEVSVRDYDLHSGGGSLDAEQLHKLEAAAGCKLMQIVSVG